MTKERLRELLEISVHELFAIEVDEASPQEMFQALANVVKQMYSEDWRQTRKNLLLEDQKQAYYFSIEFLPGKMLKSNLLNMQLLEQAEAVFEELGVSLDEVADTEKDMALGNGGLGRLASCFMDSLASLSLPGNGNGIRYRYGLFKQKFIDGHQVELPDDWLRSGNVWEVRKESKAVPIRFGGQVYLVTGEDGKLTPVYEGGFTWRAVPYDTAMVGYQNQHINTLRLWSVEVPAEDEAHYATLESRQALENLTAVLYPDDSNEIGKRTRLMQEYFFVSAGIQSIIRYYKKSNLPLAMLSERVAIHINDTHPALCVPELMRILVDEEGLAWEQAWSITVKVMSYTNHTIMAEALEKWPVRMIEEVLPRMDQIIKEIDRRFVEGMQGVHPQALLDRTRIIIDDQVHMAHLAIIGSHSVNGVAKLHSDLLKSVVLHDFYLIYPARFNNKTNGIAQRRWLQLANQPLAKVLDQSIGTSWRNDPLDLQLLKNYYDDETVLQQIADAKMSNKRALAKYIQKATGITVDPTAIFDVQIKRLHAYKRQLLNLMHILKLYFEVKDDPTAAFHPRVFIFGAKAAPSYHYAKSIIKVINEVANLINHDETINDKIKVIFLENYNVSLAEKIIPAADVSEQISLASKEASGTSNMKLMLNGAVTIATLDGANIEIRDAIGDENIAIFGLTEEEVYQYYAQHNYSAYTYYESDPVLQRVVNAFIDGTIPNIQVEGREIFDSLLKYNDEYFLLKDFHAYCDAQHRVDSAYQDTQRWRKVSLMNIANAGKFSADETVRNYAADIWQIDPLFAHVKEPNAASLTETVPPAEFS
ncbi:glycogen/starch/alpha-glucan phosphorylase [Enterococcus casseliflavus]|jgi:starch phosphorylase|uniref:glycogen/starch/alpha-glucan phosphorylase n=1 Tax=Enterococcus casseliflavus TaxID=37734 RepID=UPI000FFB1C96|nr:glycogen/starch/alpha-glucan phosphorylase [Enterococcus casseliflavus]RXA62567.1 glycogen/starch/alpha-glucan phosphorylase [Enterococcus casseliflavus]